MGHGVVHATTNTFRAGPSFLVTKDRIVQNPDKKRPFYLFWKIMPKKVQLGRIFVRASQLRGYIVRSQVLKLSVASQKTPFIVLVLTSTNTVTIEPCFDKLSYQALGNKLANGYRS